MAESENGNLILYSVFDGKPVQQSSGLRMRIALLIWIRQRGLTALLIIFIFSFRRTRRVAQTVGTLGGLILLLLFLLILSLQTTERTNQWVAMPQPILVSDFRDTESLAPLLDILGNASAVFDNEALDGDDRELDVVDDRSHNDAPVVAADFAMHRARSRNTVVVRLELGQVRVLSLVPGNKTTPQE